MDHSERPPDRPLSASAWGRFFQYQPHAIVFFSSACIMVVELVAGRLIARYLGSSLYTWTSIIGVVLAGMSVGNYLGGRLADRRRPEHYLGWLFLAASVTCLSTILLNNLFARHDPLSGLTFPVRVFSTVVSIFMLPALVLGTISPAAAKMALDRSSRVGTTIGSVYAWGTAGSIVGTLATGFFLIAALGTRGVVLTICIGLGLLGLALGPRRIVHAAWVLLLVGGWTFSASGASAGTELAYELGLKEGWKHNGRWYTYRYAREGHYQLVKVYDKTSKRTGKKLRVLGLDHLIHGYICPDDPTHLEYGYEQLYAHLTHRVRPGDGPVSALFLGAGSYTLPRWLEATRPGSTIDAAEIDPLVLEANHEAMGLPRDTSIRTLLMDARQALRELRPAEKYDLVYSDAFNDLSIPFHLTTREFYQELAAHMKPGGAVLQNIIDIYDHGHMLGATTATLRTIFKNVYVFSTERHGAARGRGTFVVVATNQTLDLSDWGPGHHGEHPGSALPGDAVAALVKRTGNRVLTDDDAPVENLLKPVVDARR